MELLSDIEREAFRMSMIGKPLPELKKIFNKLAKERNDECLSDNSRGKAAEKMAMVKWTIKVRKMGGAEG